MRVLLVDDDPECLKAAAGELEAAGHETLCFESFGAMRLGLEGVGIDAAVLDLEVPGESAYDAMRWLGATRPGMPILAMTSHATDDYLFSALQAGAVGYVLKHDALGALARVVGECLAGGAPMSPRIARRVLETFRGAPASTPEALSPDVELPTARELEVLHALSRGLTYQECGAALGIGIDTVRSHVRNVYRKLHAASKAEAVAMALRHGWLT
jgi:DNA-binding NarL/FixJ family response regulator